VNLAARLLSLLEGDRIRCKDWEPGLWIGLSGGRLLNNYWFELEDSEKLFVLDETNSNWEILDGSHRRPGIIQGWPKGAKAKRPRS